jgi:hypothetical protein
MQEWVLYIMTWASQLSGYAFPDKLPEVQWESESWFSHRVCKDQVPCPVFGLYEDRDIVFLREDLTDSAKDHVAQPCPTTRTTRAAGDAPSGCSNLMLQ